MTERQYKTEVELCRAIAAHGSISAQARLAAIEFCYAYNIHPFFRHAVQINVEPTFSLDFTKPSEIPHFSQWEVVVSRFSDDFIPVYQRS